MSDAPARVVLSDDNVVIRLAIYAAAQTDPLAAAELSVPDAVRLVAELAAAASRHMGLARNHAAGVRRGI